MGVQCAQISKIESGRHITFATAGSPYITAELPDGTPLRDRVGTVDAKRLADGEITLQDLAYKHFAYLVD